MVPGKPERVFPGVGVYTRSFIAGYILEGYSLKKARDWHFSLRGPFFHVSLAAQIDMRPFFASGELRAYTGKMGHRERDRILDERSL